MVPSLGSSAGFAFDAVLEVAGTEGGRGAAGVSAGLMILGEEPDAGGPSTSMRLSSAIVSGTSTRFISSDAIRTALPLPLRS